MIEILFARRMSWLIFFYIEILGKCKYTHAAYYLQVATHAQASPSLLPAPHSSPFRFIQTDDSYCVYGNVHGYCRAMRFSRSIFCEWKSLIAVHIREAIVRQMHILLCTLLENSNNIPHIMIIFAIVSNFTVCMRSVQWSFYVHCELHVCVSGCWIIP